MPARHRYKCLNPGCPSMTDARIGMTFTAMNAPSPECPECGSLTLEDWGEAVNVMAGSSAATRDTDAFFRRTAERYGLTDMSNRDGSAVKRATAPAAPAGGETINVGGFQLPLAAALSGTCVTAATAVPVRAPIFAANHNSPGAMKGMTHIVAEHKGQP